MGCPVKSSFLRRLWLRFALLYISPMIYITCIFCTEGQLQPIGEVTLSSSRQLIAGRHYKLILLLFFVLTVKLKLRDSMFQRQRRSWISFWNRGIYIWLCGWCWRWAMFGVGLWYEPTPTHPLARLLTVATPTTVQLFLLKIGPYRIYSWSFQSSPL